jgi:hypothetical protein
MNKEYTVYVDSEDLSVFTDVIANNFNSTSIELIYTHYWSEYKITLSSAELMLLKLIIEDLDIRETSND